MNDLRSRERGNVLFLILIAVALFGALSYTVAEMMRGGNVNIGDEQSRIYAGEVLDYGRNIRQAVQSMRISNGCRDADISFENTVEAGYANGTNTECQVFSPDGGGLNYLVPVQELLDSAFSAQPGYGDYFFSGNVRVQNIGSGTGGNEDLELVLFLPYLKQSICQQINSSLNTSTSSGDIPSENADAWHSGFSKFIGSYGDALTRQLDGESPVGLSGCREGAGTPPSDSYYFYQVLISR